MRPEELPQRLSQISTMWTVLQQAHTGSADAKTAALELLMLRYGGAVQRYLRSALRDAAAAEDLTQDFALALVRGDFRRADPGRGRFRDYLKTILFHLVSRYRKRQQKHPQPLPADSPKLAGLAARREEIEQQFDANWRDQLLARTWKALGGVQPLLYSVLRLRAAHPTMPSPELAQRLAVQLVRPVTAAGVRQTLRRAREKFAQLLLEEVSVSLERPTAALVEQELRDLDLLEYCRPALAKHTFAE